MICIIATNPKNQTRVIDQAKDQDQANRLKEDYQVLWGKRYKIKTQ